MGDNGNISEFSTFCEIPCDVFVETFLFSFAIRFCSALTRISTERQ